MLAERSGIDQAEDGGPCRFAFVVAAGCRRRGTTAKVSSSAERGRASGADDVRLGRGAGIGMSEAWFGPSARGPALESHDRGRVVDRFTCHAPAARLRGHRREGCTIAVAQTITFLDEDDANVMFPEDGAVRIEVLQRLAEQAMSDAEFRRCGARRLPGALERTGTN